ncbi:aspartyl/glutamyl-tRNA(Asn/Gln) amidotransferase subunit B [Gammaproteobacteria bacterium]|nr:aspartyl/glutamyl-tRNA(Asn/Gln) amidotransferase subunit B [Gammaproteobacteria bacterium]
MTWEVVIGLEVHTQLTTQTKIFSGSPIAYGKEPNTQASLVDLAMPGTLPVLNHAAVTKACIFGLASNSVVAQRSVFDRKNYFYPDLPKGYQISQLSFPIVHSGYLDIKLDDGSIKRIGITRAHLEEDAGKSLHNEFQGLTGIDLNRAGTPLLEIVSEPDLSSAKEAISYLKKLHQLVTWLGICDGNMQEGSFRCDANVSIRKFGEELGTRAEVKNINSFRNIELAINHEVERQIDIIEGGGKVIQETRLYDADKNETRSMRSKEEANDYRYFPDPDLLPVFVDLETIDAIRASLPELPEARLHRFIHGIGLSEYDATVLTATRGLSDYFEDVIGLNNPDEKFIKLSANWINGELQAYLNKNNLNIENSPISAINLSALITRICDDTISGKIAKDVFEIMWINNDLSPDQIIEANGLKQVTDINALSVWVAEIIAANPKQVEQYINGNTKLLGFFVGQIMKLSGGKANPEVINALVLEKLAKI